MKFGVREICDVVFKALQPGKIGSMDVVKGQPVLYIDSAKTSTIEGTASPVYATGGRGNARLVSWEGEKTLTFTVEDALLSEIGFAILSGAGLFDLTQEDAMVHCTEVCYLDGEDNLTVSQGLCTSAPIFIMSYSNGSFGKRVNSASVTKDGDTVISLTNAKFEGVDGATLADSDTVFFVDYYTKKTSGVTEIQIDAEHFAGYYYVEASTLFRRESDGVDMPAEIVFPKVKVQSNFTFTMASTGDPSTFTFTMDAFPGYTMFEKTKKVLCAIQIIDDAREDEYTGVTVTTLAEGETVEIDGEVVAGSVTKQA